MKLQTPRQNAQAEHALNAKGIRAQAVATASNSRSQMVERDWKRNPTHDYPSGTLVTLRIPKQNRVAGQNKRLLCRVLSQSTPGRYHLQSEHGVLNTTYPTGELDRMATALSFSLKAVNPGKKITLNFASRLDQSVASHAPVNVCPADS